MRVFVISLFALMLFFGSAPAQQPDSTSADTTATQETAPAVVYKAPVTPPPTKSSSGPSRIYYGGTLGFSFGDYTRISISPLIGYRLSKMWSVGGRFIYEYIKDKRYTEEYTASNYGGSLFARLRPHPRFYLHGEYEYMSYDYPLEREWVPFLLLGGGYVQPISKKASFFVEVLFDVLNDDGSPYAEWDPWISIGVAAGF
jgi:hypothetical protein